MNNKEEIFMKRTSLSRGIRFGALSLTLISLAVAAIPSGTDVRVRLGQTISSDKAKSGESWQGTLAEDLVVDGRTIAKRGANVSGVVAEAKSSGRLSDPGILKLKLTSVAGQHVNTSLVVREGESHKGRNVKSAGGTAAVGAIIGAIAGGGKGAAIGAGAGAAAGTAGAAATGKKDVRIPVETVLTFTTQ
jgi:hypothetical protein